MASGEASGGAGLHFTATTTSRELERVTLTGRYQERSEEEWGSLTGSPAPGLCPPGSRSTRIAAFSVHGISENPATNLEAPSSLGIQALGRGFRLRVRPWGQGAAGRRRWGTWLRGATVMLRGSRVSVTIEPLPRPRLRGHASAPPSCPSIMQVSKWRLQSRNNRDERNRWKDCGDL